MIRKQLSLLLLTCAGLAAAGTGYAAGHAAFVWADNPTAERYNPSATYAHNPAGGAIEISRGATVPGQYLVRFAGMSLADGNVQVTAYGGDNRRCKVVVWNTDGVSVRCFDPAGRPADARYTVLFSRAEGAGGPAYAWGHDPTAARYTPSARYAHNPAGGAIEISRGATGRYRVRFAGMSLGGGNVQVTAYGADDRRCKVAGWSGDSVNVHCLDPAGRAADARFSVLFQRAEEAGGGAAYLWADNPTAARYAPSTTYAHNPAGGAIEVTRSGSGAYRARFAGLSLGGGNVQGTAYGSDDRRCKVVGWGGDAVNVRCFDPAGNPADARFSLLYSTAEHVLTPPAVAIRTDLVPATATLPDPDGGEPRPVVRYRNDAGKSVDFVADELIVVTDDATALETFLRSHGGRVMSEMSFGELAVEGFPTIYRVRVDPGVTEMSDFAKRWRDSARATGTQTFSDAAGPQLLATALDAMESETLVVSLNVLLESQTFLERSTSDEGTCCTAPDSTSFSPDAFTWPYMKRGIPQDIGTAEAWRVLDAMGRLGNRVKIGVADGGFIPNGDFPANLVAVGPLRTPNPDPSACGSDGAATTSCRWHGTHVVMSGMAQVDNGRGAAGSAGPVADLVILQSPAVDFFTIFNYIFESLPRALADRPRIVNISASVELPAEACLAVLAGAPICEALHSVARGFREAGILVFAAAGNADRDVDQTKEFGFCPFCVVEEAEIVIPCELDQVVCVGGLSWNATGKHRSSNFGSNPRDAQSVDIFGPYEVWSVGDPAAADLARAAPNTAARIVGGTSFASPYVAGVAALVWAADPTLGPNEVERILMETAHTESGDSLVPRWVNALAAVQRAVGGDTPPFLRITSPEDGASLSGGTYVDLTAEAEDLEGEVSVVWRLDGVELPGRRAATRVRLDAPFGRHTIEAQAFDRTGNASPVDRVSITLENDPPTVDIVAPSSGDRRCSDQDIFASADVNDPNGYLDATAGTWSASSMDLGTGTTVTVAAGSLPAGVHTLRYVVRDGSFTVEDSVTFEVADCPATRPRILSPSEGEILVLEGLGVSVCFDATYGGLELGHGWEIIPDDTGVPLPSLCPPNPPFPRDGYGCGDLRFCQTFRDRSELGSYTIRFTVFPSGLTDEVHIEVVRPW